MYYFKLGNKQEIIMAALPFFLKQQKDFVNLPVTSKDVFKASRPTCDL